MRDDQPLHRSKITLLGRGPVEHADFLRATRLARDVVAVDGGAEHAFRFEHGLSAIIGDFDSISNEEFWRKSGVELKKIEEQETTDLAKALYSTEAQIYLGLGFLGRRVDHTLAALNTLCVYSHKNIVLLGEFDVAFHCPQRFSLDVDSGARISFFPMAEVSGLTSDGLEWSLDGLEFAPARQIGTSNRASKERITVHCPKPGMICMVENRYFEAVVSAMSSTDAHAKSG